MPSYYGQPMTHYTPCTAHAIFKTPAKAAAALPKLHSHVYKGSVLSVILKKRVDSLVKNVTSSKSSTGGQSTKLGPNRGGRIIVRNLPWNVSCHYDDSISCYLIRTCHLDYRSRPPHTLHTLRPNPLYYIAHDTIAEPG